MMRVLKVSVVVLILSGLLVGCQQLFCFQVSGPITQWSYHISPFSKLRVYNSPQIYITQGDSQSVVVESEENMFHALLFHIDPFAELLYIDFDETCIDDIDHFKIFITIDTLKELDLRSGGEVWVEDTMNTDSLRVLISGDAKVNIDKLNANHVLTQISGAGDVRYTGIDTVARHVMSFSGIGSVYSFGMPCKHVDVSVSGAALVQTTVSDSLNVTITGTGEVHYRGFPIITENISGDGQVIDAN